MAERKRPHVHCTTCEWKGRRVAEGGPCPLCEQPVVFTPTAQSTEPEGLKTVVMHLRGPTVRYLDSVRTAQNLYGRATAGALLLDTLASGELTLDRWVELAELDPDCVPTLVRLSAVEGVRLRMAGAPGQARAQLEVLVGGQVVPLRGRIDEAGVVALARVCRALGVG